jgi:hypothetical protein
VEADALLFTAGAPQQLEIRTSGGSGGRGPFAVDLQREFHVAISAGTPGQLLDAFRTKVGDQIEAMGATIEGTGSSGTDADLRAFSYDYSWRGNEGVIRVHSFVGADGMIEIILFCYEHPR